MLIEFDQTTIANMTAALDSVCKRIPPHKDARPPQRGARPFLWPLVCYA